RDPHPVDVEAIDLHGDSLSILPSFSMLLGLAEQPLERIPISSASCWPDLPYLSSASAPAWATCASCCEVPPDTPMAPMIAPPTMTGTPPSKTVALPSFSNLRFTPPCAIRSWNTFVGRLNATAV